MRDPSVEGFLRLRRQVPAGKGADRIAGRSAGRNEYRTAPAGIERSAQVPSSIAVLPFANLSGDPKKVYFSDGVTDQLITELAQTPSLRVAARSSSFAFRDKNVDVKTIAKVLNVRTVLEGSVREDGKRVRIAAELVDAANGFQIWSESYDRDLTNILSLQDEISRIWQEQQRTVVLITNDVDEGVLLADYIIPLSSGPEATLGPRIPVHLPRPGLTTEVILQDDVSVPVVIEIAKSPIIVVDRANALAALRQAQVVMDRLTRLSPDNAGWKRALGSMAKKIAALTR